MNGLLEQRRWGGLLVFLLVLILTGCSLFSPKFNCRPVPAYFDDPRDTAMIRRVLLLPFSIEGEGDANPQMVDEVFCKELQKTGRFEVLNLPGDAREKWMRNNPRRTGRFDVEVLLDLCSQFGADALIYGTVTRFRAYAPPVLGLRLGMISAHTGQTAWETEVLYDFSDTTVYEDLKSYTTLFKATEVSYHDWEMTVISPRKYTAYVCYRLVDRWRVVDASYR